MRRPTASGADRAVDRFCAGYNRHDAINGFPLVVVVDDSEFAARTLDNFLWTTFTRSNPAADIYGIEPFLRDKHWGCFGSLVIDARSKPHHAPPVEEDPEVTSASTPWPPAAGRCTGSFERRMNLSEPEWLVALWLLALGGLIGSFLNVVVYRLPAGMSIVRPGSHCPACRHPIRWFDNVPVLSWFLLRGRCRDCRAAISPRYPLVEAATAGLFLLLAFGELFPGGGNLPRPRDPLSEAQLWGIYAYHLVLLCTLLAAALVQYDGHRPPGRLFLPAAGGRVGGPGVLAHVASRGRMAGRGRTAPWDSRILDRGRRTEMDGGRGGCWAGWPAVAAVIRGCASAAACVGLFLGWQAVCGLVVLTAVVSWLLRAAARGRPEVRRLPPVAWLALGTLGWILAWGLLVQWVPLV